MSKQIINLIIITREFKFYIWKKLFSTKNRSNGMYCLRTTYSPYRCISSTSKRRVLGMI